MCRDKCFMCVVTDEAEELTDIFNEILREVIELLG